jgi:serine phosphatase RsbU (regulator of sigma subunit)
MIATTPSISERMNGLLTGVAHRLWPGLQHLKDERYLSGVADVFGFLYGLPLALIGLIWLWAETDLDVIGQEWPLLTLQLALVFTFSRLSFYLIAEIRPGRYANSDGSLEGSALWSSVFLFGPTALWIGVVGTALNVGLSWRSSSATFTRWNWARNLMFGLATATLTPLIGLRFYRRWGGTYPLAQLTSAHVIPALGAILISVLAFFLIYTGYSLYMIWGQRHLSEPGSGFLILRFILITIGLPHLAHPFGILATGVFTQNGLFSYLFFLSGMLLVALMARQFSLAAERNRRQSRQLEKLEQLGRDIISSPPDGVTLSKILATHVPSMFPANRLAIWTRPNRFLLRHPPEWSPDADSFWEWMQGQSEPKALLSQDQIPWSQEEIAHPPVVVSPIFDIESMRTIGGIYIELQDLIQPWDARTLKNLLPAVQSLAAQIASALREAWFYVESINHQRRLEELRLAGQIQSSFLPNEFPIASGWELAVTILPARETSGDYFDFIPLPENRLGVLVADVADKGLGPALYMALSRTLIRTYASEFALDPDVVFYATNGRILEDARANLFVTAFYGVLDQETGTLTYCNAGHNPPLLIRSKEGGKVEKLDITGIPIGIEAEAVWNAATVKIDAGDVLLLYTDGIPDSQNDQEEFFTEDRLINMAHACLGAHAQQIQADIIQAVQDFVGDGPQVDDITLMVLQRAPESVEDAGA